MKSGTHEATSGNLPVPEAVSPIGTTPTVDSQARTFTTPGRLQQLGRYIILGQLGVGGMSIVHEAYDPELDRKVALKILRGVPGGVSTQGRLLREGQALARINHTNVVRVYDVGIDQGQLFIAMERIDGTTLRAWLASAKRSLAEILRVFIAAGRGLAEAHAAGIIHRDFKPENALIDATGTLRIVDFGLARALADDLERSTERVETAPGLGLPFTQVGAIVGTLAYMAPEQLEGHEVDVRVDIFAVCVALFEALHGARPFTGDTAQELLASIERGPPARPPRAGSQELHALIVRGLAADPKDRWPTIAALTDRLQAIARPSRRRAAALAVLAVAAGVGTFATLPGAPPPCSGVGDEIVDTWGPTIAASVGEVFSPGDRGFVGATWRRALPQLDGYAERWSTTRLAVCEAREQGAVSERLHDLEVACLESRRQSLAATVAVIRRRGASMVDELEALVEVLPDLASCRDPARVQIRWAPPDDPEVAARAAALEGRLVDAEASMAGGELARADALVQEIAAALSGLPMPALVAELTRIEGQLASRMGRDDAHQDALQRHFAASLTIADHEAAGLAAAELMRGSVGSEATGVAETWQAVAEALLAGPGTRPLALATFQARLGEVAVGRGDLEAALRANEAGLAIAHEGSGLPWTLHALLLDHALGAEVMLGRHEKSERWTTELLGLLTEHRADGHPDQVRARTILAEGSIHSGDLARASAALDEAEAMLARGGITRTDLGFEVAAQRALLAGVRNDLAGLDAAAEKALALAGSPRDRLRVHGYVSSTYTNAGQYDRAIAAAKAGLAAVATDNTPELVLRRHETLLQLGLACLGGGRLDEADAAFVEAIERISTEPNTGALTLLEARIGLGSVLTQRGKWAEARSELEQILASIAGQKFPPGYLGNLHFSFARALWGPENRRPSAADETRAREQAALAIRDFTGVPSAESAIVEVESWLTTHPPAPPKR